MFLSCFIVNISGWLYHNVRSLSIECRSWSDKNISQSFNCLILPLSECVVFMISIASQSESTALSDKTLSVIWLLGEKGKSFITMFKVDIKIKI
jgi:hypothetical protein